MGCHLEIYGEEFTREYFQNNINVTTSNLHGFIVTMFFPREQNPGVWALFSALFISVKSYLIRRPVFSGEIGTNLQCNI